MNRTMITATNTLSQLQKQMDIIGSNLANSDTTAYKRSEGTFSELLVQQFNNQPREDKEKGRLTPFGIRQGVGAQIGLIKQVQSQGPIKNTDRALDVALLQENQYFKINVNNEVQYTRDGAFYFSPIEGNQLRLVTGDGHAILDANNQPIVVNDQVKDILFKQDGTLMVTSTNGNTQNFQLGVVSVQNPQYLEHKQGNIVGLSANAAQLGINEANILTNLTGAQRQQISLKQNALEGSNVDISKEITDLMNAQRQYQLQSRSISVADQMLGLINSVR